MTCAALAILLAAGPSARVVPPKALPGDAFLVVVRGATAAPTARAAGRDLSFWPVAGGFAAVGGLPVETPPGPLAIAIEAPAGSEPPVRLEASLRVSAAAFPHRELSVQRRYVEPLAPEVQRRVDEDRAAFARAFDEPPSPPLFDGPFAWPRKDRVTAGYGETRTMHATFRAESGTSAVKPSQHYGLDLAGKVGAPVAAANGGRVVLVRDCWASGRSVVVWHGAGIFTTYLHLSRALVREGQGVRRGERLGLVGATGRVSGPHLHWGVKVGDLYVDPRSVLGLAWPARR